MLTIIFTIIFALAAIIGIVWFINASVSYKKEKKQWPDEASPASKYAALLVTIVAILFVPITLIVGTATTVSPYEVALAYDTDGSVETLHTGLNFVSPLAKVGKVGTQTVKVVFSEGAEDADIYGAQTSEKDYIQIVATISYGVDTAKIIDYVSRFKYESVDNETLVALLKTTSRSAVESVIGSMTTSDVMSKKSEVNTNAATAFKAAVADLPIIIYSFTIDDLVAPTSYEQTIQAQAQLRQETQTAELQKQLNETQAAADKIKAEGEAQVAEVKAQNEANVAKINAQKEAEVAKINAEKEAEALRIKTENENALLKATAEAEAEKVQIEAQAAASAAIVAGEAEAQAAKALAEVYKTNPEVYQLKLAEIQAEVEKAWAEKWAGIDLSGISPTITYADLSSFVEEIVTKVTAE